MMEQANENVLSNGYRNYPQLNGQLPRLNAAHLAAKSSRSHHASGIPDGRHAFSAAPLKSVNPNNHDNLPPSREEYSGVPLVSQRENAVGNHSALVFDNGSKSSPVTRLRDESNKRPNVSPSMASDIKAAHAQLQNLHHNSFDSTQKYSLENVDADADFTQDSELDDDEDEVFYETSPEVPSVQPVAMVDASQHSHRHLRQPNQVIEQPVHQQQEARKLYDQNREHINYMTSIFTPEAESSFTSKYCPALLTESLKPWVTPTIVPHMSQPLADNSIPLQIVTFESAMDSKVLSPYAPFGGLVSDAECYQHSDEQKLLNVLNLDIEALDEKEVYDYTSLNADNTRQFLWMRVFRTVRQVGLFLLSLFRGLSDDEYLAKYPWAKYVHNNADEWDESEEEALNGFDVNSFSGVED